MGRITGDYQETEDIQCFCATGAPMYLVHITTHFSQWNGSEGASKSYSSHLQHIFMLQAWFCAVDFYHLFLIFHKQWVSGLHVSYSDPLKPCLLLAVSPSDLWKEYLYFNNDCVCNVKAVVLVVHQQEVFFFCVKMPPKKATTCLQRNMLTSSSASLVVHFKKSSSYKK